MGSKVIVCAVTEGFTRCRLASAKEHCVLLFSLELDRRDIGYGMRTVAKGLLFAQPASTPEVGAPSLKSHFVRGFLRGNRGSHKGFPSGQSLDDTA